MVHGMYGVKTLKQSICVLNVCGLNLKWLFTCLAECVVIFLSTIDESKNRNLTESSFYNNPPNSSSLNIS
jgi:hypothetical protein